MSRKCILLCLGIVLAACSASSGPGASTDAGPGADAGIRADAGFDAGTDAGPVVATVTVDAMPSSAPADGQATIELRVTAVDSAGKRVSGAEVTRSGTEVTRSGTGSGNTFAPPTGLTDSTGVFTTTMSASVAGARTVTATVGGVLAAGTFAGGGSASTDSQGVARVMLASSQAGLQMVSASAGGVSKQLSVTFTPVPSTAKSTLVASTSSAPADGSTTIALTLTVLDANGVAIPDLSVTFAGTGAGNTFSPSATGTTASDGTVQVNVLSTIAGSTTVSASASGLTIAAVALDFTLAPCSKVSFKAVTVGEDTQPWGVSLADLDGDGSLDIAVANNQSAVSVLFNDGQGNFGTVLLNTCNQ